MKIKKQVCNKLLLNNGAIEITLIHETQRFYFISYPAGRFI